MSKKKITIRMPKEKLDLWLRALRLPANQKLQGTGALFNRHPNLDVYQGELPEKRGYCCLGVLQCVVSGGKVQSGGYPRAEWLEKEGIEFFDKYGRGSEDEPYLPLLRQSASNANDVTRKTFKQIAQAIESCAVGY